MLKPANPNEFKIVYPVSLVEQVTEFLTNSIIEGRLRGGQHLGENELQSKFGVSRGPIRESFRLLEKKGLVTTIPRKGTFVRKVCRKNIEENFPIRGLLEGFAARLAVSHFQQADVDGMELAFAKMVQAVEEKDFNSYLRCHSEYHDILIRASRNDALIEILENLRRQAMWYRFLSLYVEESFKDELQVHRNIIDSLVSRDAEGIEQLVKHHILSAHKRFSEFLSSNNPEEKQDE